MDDELAEAWERVTPEPDILGVEASRIANAAWPWQVSIYVAEFVRDDPLETDLRLAIGNALRGVPGVTNVMEEDREVWVLSGDPSGRALIESAGAALDRLADRTRAYLASMTSDDEP